MDARTIVYVQLGKPFTSLKGDKVKKFVLAGPKIVELLTKNLEENIIVLSLLKALLLWYKIEKFLKVVMLQRIEWKPLTKILTSLKVIFKHL